MQYVLEWREELKEEGENTLRVGVPINQTFFYTHEIMYCQERMQVCRWIILSVPYLNILCSPSFVGKATIIAGQQTDPR